VDRLRVIGIRVSRTGRILSWASDTVRLWDAATGRELVPAMHHEGGGWGSRGRAAMRGEQAVLAHDPQHEQW
jgi:hypothetical protein